MKKRFVAKQVGVLSLTAVLAGMPAVNVLAEDVYAQKVESLQKEMLEQAVATETKLNIIFETVHGEKVGETVKKQQRQEQVTGHSCLEQIISYQKDTSLQQE